MLEYETNFTDATIEPDYTLIITEMRDVLVDTQYIQLTQAALLGFIIALIFVLIFTIVWGRQ